LLYEEGLNSLLYSFSTSKACPFNMSSSLVFIIFIKRFASLSETSVPSFNAYSLTWVGVRFFAYFLISDIYIFGKNDYSKM